MGRSMGQPQAVNPPTDGAVPPAGGVQERPDTQPVAAGRDRVDQFVDPARGSVLLQSLLLAAVQIVIAAIGDLLFVLAAARVARWLAERPAWVSAQRWVLGGVFGAIAVKLAFDSRR